MAVETLELTSPATPVQLTVGPRVSVVLPVHNERAALPALVDEIESALGELEFEVVAIDDGSTDGSDVCLEALRRDRPWLRVYRHGFNRGQTAALETGIAVAAGVVIVLLDSDGQNDPADIPRLLAELTPGIDVVAGRRRGRHESPTRRLASAAANWLLRRAAAVPVHDTGCTLKAYRAETLKGLRLLRGDHRFLPALARTGAGRIAEVWVADRPRTAGRSHYGYGRIPVVAADLLGLALRRLLSSRPLHTAAAGGLVLAAAWTAVAAVLVIAGDAALAALALLVGLSLAGLAVLLGTALEDALRR